MPYLRYAKAPGIYGFRFRSHWIKWKDTRKHPLLFSERNGYARVFLFGPWALCISNLDRR